METATVSHEVGHVLSLAHPFSETFGCECSLPTVMGYPEMEEHGFSEVITWHDEYNILDKYGA